MSKLDTVELLQDDHISKLSNGALSVKRSPSQGSHIFSSKALKGGEVLLECLSDCVALDPPFRNSHCGYCASPLASDSDIINSSDQQPVSTCCSDCHLLAICSRCEENGVRKWHSESGECRILKCLVRSFQSVFSEMEGVPTQKVVRHIESIYVITMRLLHRRHYDTINKFCPLPTINWELLDTLYGSPLDNNKSSSFVQSMATLLQVMKSLLQQEKQYTESLKNFHLNPHDCISIWRKCLGCCHGITDLSRELGDQNLGIALFISQSFYNHACAPNAFLSCLLAGKGGTPESNDNANGNMNTDHPCGVRARVVCGKATGIPESTAVTLSYIPLSGLCKRERQIRLQKTYHFQCDCLVCHDADSPRTLAFDLEQAVGGDFASSQSTKSDEEFVGLLAPLRELQIDCYQNLQKASAILSLNDKEGEDACAAGLVDQSIATLEMAQRGIRNQGIPASHEVSLECHRLLAVAYSLLQRPNQQSDSNEDDPILQELHHHEQFLAAAAGPAKHVLDPSALAIQHSLIARCMNSKFYQGASDKGVAVLEQGRHHANLALETAALALGDDHPFVLSLKGIQTKASTEGVSKRALAKKRSPDDSSSRTQKAKLQKGS